MLEETSKCGDPGANLILAVGLIETEDLKEIANAILEDCNRLDLEGWANPPELVIREQFKKF